MSEKPFFVVWNPSHGLPIRRHSSYRSAVNEAKRLAHDTPGQHFYVLAACVAVMREQPVRITPLLEGVTEKNMPLVADDDGIPF